MPTRQRTSDLLTLAAAMRWHAACAPTAQLSVGGVSHLQLVGRLIADCRLRAKDDSPLLAVVRTTHAGCISMAAWCAGGRMIMGGHGHPRASASLSGGSRLAVDGEGTRG